MIPSTLSTQLEQGLRSSLWSSTPGMEHLVGDFLGQDQAAWKGPWVDLKLPFVPGINPAFFPNVPMPFTPHAHQEAAFQRLGDRHKRSTLIATGTGSGKTECFLLPILAHCLAEQGRRGVKAILIYPMNALATDQALRIAKLVHGNPELRGKVRAGLYVGESKSGKSQHHTQMGADHLITERDVLRNEPPDILLTNYKMLDYMLLRPKDQPLWRHNAAGVLRFVVVDELHTFDGAQGTDLACLIRRLKRRLEADYNDLLCCVGTSATLGGEDSADTLKAYAAGVFGQTFDDGAIISEQRLTVAQFLDGAEVQHDQEPGPADLPTLTPDPSHGPDPWLKAQARLWLAEQAPTATDPAQWAIELGERLRHHQRLHRLLEQLGDGPMSVDQLATALSANRNGWLSNPAFARAATLSLLGLVSAARAWRTELPQAQQRREAEGKARPTDAFLDVRLQAWQRELARMVASVDDRPQLTFSDDLDRSQRKGFLPLVRCADCGALGWATLRDANSPRDLTTDLRRFYGAWFSRNDAVRILFPSQAVPRKTGVRRSQSVLRVVPGRLQVVREGEEDFDEAYEVIEAPNLRTVQRKGVPRQESHQDCPFCGGADRLLITGFRTATLAGVDVDQLFGSPFNDDKRLLAFSDSVQDAAHRAGFLSARTWRTNTRLAIVQALPEDGTPVGLDQVTDRVVRHWRDAVGLDEVRFLSAFLPPDMAWLHDWDHVRRRGVVPTGSNLVELVTRRLGWEVFGEAGLWAARGRSVERVGAVATQLRADLLDEAVTTALEPLRNEVPGLRWLDEDTLATFLVGLLHGARLRGAVFHEAIPESYLKAATRFAFKGRHLPWVGQRSRLPALLTDTPGTERYDCWLKANSWYATWVARVLSHGGLAPEAADLFNVLLPLLASAGVMRRLEGTAKRRPFVAWGLEPHALQLTRDVQTLRCSDCGSRHTIAEAANPRWAGMPCHGQVCSGTLQPVAREPDYFGQLYARGDLQRVFAEEHTGLLDRERRESVERRFKAADPPDDFDPAKATEEEVARYRRPWDPNLLSCTPTLEMGIDVGDLSSTLLCSVPPAQANYLQRIGRAGRRDGNAFVLTIANAKAHDRYFWEQPEEMLAGQVDPPGLFLDAVAVLERHLAAFCLDRWVARLGTEADLPNELQPVLGAVARADTSRFPYPWFDFIEAERSQLLSDFRQMFEAVTSAHALDALEAYLQSEDPGGDHQPLTFRLLQLFEQESKQIKALSRDVSDLAKEIKALKNAPVLPTDADEQLGELELEKSSLQHLVAAAKKRKLLEFLTDHGFLPNYAFPESAVRLQTVIWRRKADKEAKPPYEHWSYEYVRSPSAALGELAPHATFYAGGRKVSIDRIDVSSEALETWRFCPSCNQTLRLSDRVDPDECPACRSRQWADPGQKHPMLELSQVFAGASDRSSRIGDDSDERRPSFYSRRMLVGFSEAESGGCWALDDEQTTFAYEFLRRASFTEVNFGPPANDTEPSLIAGDQESRQGFAVCTQCGTVQDGEGEPKHTRFCRGTRKGSTPKIVEGLFLYRHFRSEALRILLPVADVSDQTRLDSFLAALQLGLRRRFGGRLDHLKSTVVTDPVPGQPLRRQFLVLYDTVPGGTGYLDELVRSEGERAPLFEALELAHERLRSCVCRRAGEGGCYRCLWGHHNARGLDGIRASVAEDMIADLLVHEPTLKPVPSIQGVSVRGLHDSKLEVRFLEALRRSVIRDKPVRVVGGIDGGHTHYTVHVGDQVWRAEPQVELGPAEGLPMVVSIDFVLRPASLADGDAPVPASSRKPIAVFLDGWTYHHDRLGKDLVQRQLLLGGGQYDVWSLTWYDLDQVLLSDPRKPPAVLDMPAAATEQLANKLHAAHLKQLSDGLLFQTLVDDLAQPRDTRWDLFAAHLLAASLGGPGDHSPSMWTRAVDAEHPPVLSGPLQAITPGRSLVFDSAPGLTVAFTLQGRQLHAFVSVDDRWTVDDDEARDRWWATLRLLQILQHLDPAPWFTVRHNVPPQLADLVHRRSLVPEPSTWVEDALERDLLDPEDATVARELQTSGLPQPVLGFNLADSRNRLIEAEALFAWPEHRVGLAPNEALIGQVPGWTLFALDDLDLDALRAAIDAGAPA